MIECNFQSTEELGILRCINLGCTNAVRTLDPTITITARCKTTNCSDETPMWVPRDPNGRNPLTHPCKNLGNKTGKSVSKCGCHVPNWRKELYKCKVMDDCVLIKLDRLVSQTNCETCESYLID